MPSAQDFSIVRGEDAVLYPELRPAVPIGGWSLWFQAQLRFGGESGIIIANCASGYNGVSGITITNSGNAQFSIPIAAGQTSGLDPKSYAYTIERRNSGYVTCLTEGWLVLKPSLR